MRILLVVVALACLLSAPLSARDTGTKRAELGSLPITFEPNRGQAHRDFRYVTNNLGPRVGFSDSAITIPQNASGRPTRIIFLGAKRGTQVRGEQRVATVSHYYTGKQRSRWQSDVQNYAQVRYASLYKGVDAVFYGDHGRLEFDFLVAPGADPRQIRLQVECGCRLRVNAAGDLTFGEGVTEQVLLRRPLAYQGMQGRRQSVESRYQILPGNRVTLVVGPYDRARELVIDPVVAFVTFLGGDAYLFFRGLAVAPDGSTWLALLGPDETSPPLRLSIVKLAASGTSVVSRTDLSTFEPIGLRIDAAGALYVAGKTIFTDESTTPGAYQSAPPPAPPGYEGQFRVFGMAAKLDSAGHLIYSTYFSAGFVEILNSLAVDGSGNLYLAGSSYSPAFPVTEGAHRTEPLPAPTAPMAFIAKLDPAGSNLVYATLFGSAPFTTAIADIAVSANGKVFLTGGTFDATFPTTPGAYRVNKPEGSAAYVAQLNQDGTGLEYSTFIGPGGSHKIFLAPDGAAYIAGISESSTFPITPEAFMSTPSPFGSIFVTKVAPGGGSLYFSTFVGGSKQDIPSALDVDASGRAHVFSYSTSTDFPQAGSALGNAIIFRLNDAGTQLEFARYLGIWLSPPTGIGVDGQGNIYAGGFASEVREYPPATGLATRDGYVELAPITTGTPFLVRVENTSAAALGKLPSAVDCGEQRINGEGNRTVRLVNVGDQPLQITGVATTGEFSQTNNCTELAGGQACEVTVKFAPTSTGAKVGTLTVTSSASASAQQVQLTGTGTNPILNLAPFTAGFGSLPIGKTSNGIPLVFTNTGTTPATVQLEYSHFRQPTEYQKDDFFFTNDCEAIAPGQSCTEFVYFKPRALGTREFWVFVVSNSAVEFNELGFQGVGTEPLTFTPQTLQFGSWLVNSTSTPQTITLTNVGGDFIALLDITIVQGPFRQTHDCPYGLDPGATCRFVVDFRPVTVGPVSEGIQIYTGTGGLQIAGLYGTGTDFQLVLTRPARTGRHAPSASSTGVMIELVAEKEVRGAKFRCEGLPTGSTCVFRQTGRNRYEMTVARRSQRLGANLTAGNYTIRVIADVAGIVRSQTVVLSLP